VSGNKQYPIFFFNGPSTQVPTPKYLYATSLGPMPAVQGQPYENAAMRISNWPKVNDLQTAHIFRGEIFHDDEQAGILGPFILRKS